MTINTKGILATLIYLALGLAIYMLLYAPEVFSWSNPWVYIVTVLWPFALMWEFVVIILWILLLVVIGGGIFLLVDYLRFMR